MSSRPYIRRFEVLPLRPLVEDCCRRLYSRPAAPAIHTIIDVPAEQTMFANGELLRRAVRNLMLGAAAAMPGSGTLVVTSAADREAVELEIADTGESLPEGAIDRVFDPGGEVHRGSTGWALAAVRQIAEAHGGNVTAANCPEGGVAFTLRIPNPVALEAAA